MKFQHGEVSDSRKHEAQDRNILSGIKIINIQMSNSIELQTVPNNTVTSVRVRDWVRVRVKVRGSFSVSIMV